MPGGQWTRQGPPGNRNYYNRENSRSNSNNGRTDRIDVTASSNATESDLLSKRQRFPPTFVPRGDLEEAQYQLKKEKKKVETLVGMLKKVKAKSDELKAEADKWEERAVQQLGRKEYYKREAAGMKSQHSTDLPFHFSIPEEWRKFRTAEELFKYLGPQLRPHGKDVKVEWIIEWCREMHRLGMITEYTMKGFLSDDFN